MESILLKRFSVCHRTFLKQILFPIHTTYQASKKSLHLTCNPLEPSATEVIDVRTEKEFLDDHIPGAKNFPVLSQAQHVDVGIQYSQDSFQARKIGAKYVSSNISNHIDQYFQDKDESYSPLVYCWRGGQRSKSLSLVLSEIGFKVFVLEGGYKTYRKFVREQLDVLPKELQFKVISGLTGTGKTYLLHQLSKRGQQVLDLEGLARHKGSLLGLWHNNVQPSQKYWESLLRKRLGEFNPEYPVWAESESRHIGNVAIPGQLFTRICEGDRYEISLPMRERVKYIINDYPNWTKDVKALRKVLSPLERYHGKKKMDYWYHLIKESRFEEFVESILQDHYDPTYSKSQSKSKSRSSEQKYFQLDNLDEQSVDSFLSQVL